MTKSNLKIFVINLKSSVDRKRIMENQLKKLGLSYEVFEAVCGADMSEDEILTYYDKEYYNSRPNYFTPGAVGSALSHYFIYKRIVDEKIEVALILEDDMALQADLPELLVKASNAIRNDEVIMLFYQSYFPIYLSGISAEQLTDKYSLYQVTDTKGLRSAGGYIINYNGAKNMLDNLLPFSSFSDDWQSFYKRNILNGIRIVYPFILNNTYEATTISPNIKGGSLTTKMSSFLNKSRIFPIYQILKLRRKLNIKKTRQCFIIDKPPIDFRKNEK